MGFSPAEGCSSVGRNRLKVPAKFPSKHWSFQFQTLVFPVMCPCKIGTLRIVAGMDQEMEPARLEQPRREYSRGLRHRTDDSGATSHHERDRSRDAPHQRSSDRMAPLSLFH